MRVYKHQIVSAVVIWANVRARLSTLMRISNTRIRGYTSAYVSFSDEYVFIY